ncbi:MULTISPECIES: amino acid permease [unclassified Corynebacterium]|uniref:amino acid permease n=1 Tax=unclassified Corynebacterium TaxID=2624378 RepID=UPI0029CA134B|nr:MULTISPECIES: amino acid permease [unclassified Corynebacterium]WPF66961.1 amino acid permease [Corynebacterium sp. 22KM0430]WPF69449.1 amino acid permease [Corynebacterium sp. 21KM1197]
MTNQNDATQLGSGLKTRHLTMMGLGSAIGAGLFLGTGVGIRAAGPSILLAYIIAGAVVMAVMYMLGEMAAARPAPGSFATYARAAFGPWAGFTLGWLFWFMMIMVLGAEMTGAAAIMASWFGVEPWIPALVCVTLFAIINLAKVSGFGEFEFWFAFIKVSVIILFLVLGVLLIFGILPGHDFVGTQHFLGDGGFMPNGIPGLAAGLLAVAFAFGGIEIVTIAAAESENPQHAIKTAIRSTLWRIGLFYLGSVLVITFLLPASQIGGAETAAESPFTQVLKIADIPGVVGFMEAVIVVSLLSAFNAQIYASSRMAYSLAAEGHAPAALGKLSKDNVPFNAVLLSMVFAFASVGLQWWNPTGLLDFLLNAVGGILIVIWIMVAASYLKLHPQLERNGELSTVRVWGYPWLGWGTIAALLAFVVLMLFDDGSRSQIFSVLVMMAVLIVLSFLTNRGSTQVGSKA